jgi:aminoglycoside phosphotransferase (APT) family kinase protein
VTSAGATIAAPDPETPEDVAKHLVAELGGDGEVHDLRRLSGGASRETWAFVHRVGHDDRSVDQRLVLRRDPPNVTTPRHGSMALEVDALVAAATHDVPVPTVVASGADFGGTGTDFVITEHVDGETLGPRIVRRPDLAEARSRFGTECGATLARIHRIDPASVPDAATIDPLGAEEERFAALGTPSAAVGLAMRLLREHQPTQVPDVVCHGDFRNGNLIVDRTGIRAVLDWELVHVGDPVSDLGWLCTQAWAFGGAEPVGGIATYDQLLDGYASEAGWRPALADVLWWQLHGSVRWAVACLAAADRYTTGERRSIDAAALARRVSENELDLLDVIEELGW